MVAHFPGLRPWAWLACSLLAMGCSGEKKNTEQEAGSCARFAHADSTITWSTSDDWDGTAYEGPALVEHGTSHEIVLYVQGAARELADDGGVDFAAIPPAGARSTISSPVALPLLAEGSQVWLFQIDDPKPTSWWQGPQRGRRLAIRDRENGTLVFGAIRDRIDGPERPHEPLAFVDPITLCSESSSDACVAKRLQTFYSVEAEADEAVRIAPGEEQDITLGGISYALSLGNAKLEDDERDEQAMCADYFGPPPGVRVDANILPKDPSSVTDEIEDGGM